MYKERIVKVREKYRVETEKAQGRDKESTEKEQRRY